MEARGWTALCPASSEHFHTPGKRNHSNGKIVFLLNKSAFIFYCIKEYPLSFVPAVEGKDSSYYNKQHFLRNALFWALWWAHHLTFSLSLTTTLWRRHWFCPFYPGGDRSRSEMTRPVWDHTSGKWLSWDSNPGSRTLKFMVLTPTTVFFFFNLKKEHIVKGFFSPSFLLREDIF